MDKIYSRKRIKIPKIKKFRFQEKDIEKKKLIKAFLICIVAILTVYSITSSLNPIFNKICTEKAKGIATNISNLESSKILKDVDYEDLVEITKDNNGSINMLKINTVQINLLVSSIAYNIQQELYNIENDEISIPIRWYYWKPLLKWLWPWNKYKNNSSR